MTVTEKSSVLAAVVAKVLKAGASEFEVEYKDREERVFAFRGSVGVGVASFRSETAKAQALRRELYGLRKKRKKMTLGGGRV